MNKKGVLPALFALSTIGALIIGAFLFIMMGIPLTGITIFIVKNGKLLAILLALLIAFKWFRK